MLINSGAFENTDVYCDIPADHFVGSWQALFACGFVTVEGAWRASPKVQLTHLGLERVQHGCPLVEPRRVFAVQNDMPLPDMTCYELILTLRQQGFSWRRLPAAVADRERLAYEVGGPREWYTGGFTVHPQYLQALLQAETLQPKGVTSIPHWSRNPATFYTALLKGEVKPHRPRAAPAALEADVDPQEMGWRPKRARRGAPLARNINEDQLVAEAEGEGGSHVQEEEDDADAMDLEAALEALMDEELANINAAAGEEERLWHELFPPGSPLSAEQQSQERSGPEVANPEASSPPTPPHMPAYETWGPFAISKTSAIRDPPYGGLQATCPFHKLSSATGCKKFVKLKDNTAQTEQQVRWALRDWCNRATQFQRQKHHMGSPGLSLSTVPAPAVIEAQRILVGPTHLVLTDADLDRQEALAAKAAERAANRKGCLPGRTVPSESQQGGASSSHQAASVGGSSLPAGNQHGEPPLWLAPGDRGLLVEDSDSASYGLDPSSSSSSSSE